MKEKYVITAFVVVGICLFNWTALLTDHIPSNVKIAEENHGKKCVLLSSQEDWYRSYEALNNYYQLINYSECMFIAQPSESPFADEQLLDATELIVYFDSREDVEFYQRLLLEELTQMTKYTFLYEASGAHVYLMSGDGIIEKNVIE